MITKTELKPFFYSLDGHGRRQRRRKKFNRRPFTSFRRRWSDNCCVDFLAGPKRSVSVLMAIIFIKTRYRSAPPHTKKKSHQGVTNTRRDLWQWRIETKKRRREPHGGYEDDFENNFDDPGPVYTIRVAQPREQCFHYWRDFFPLFFLIKNFYGDLMD